jgi:hypothetical protein
VLLDKKHQVKLIKSRLFLNDKSELIRIVSVVKRDNTVKIFNYHNFENETMAYDTASFYLSPIFRIGEVSKILDKKPDTLRKYEQSGAIPKARKVAINKDGSVQIRIYTLRDVYDLIELFSMRSSGGRRSHYGTINKVEALKLVNARFQKIKNVGG